MECLDKLAEADRVLEQALRDKSPDEVRVFVRDLLKEAKGHSGRTVKFYADYLLGRMAEIARDLVEDEDSGMADKFMAVMGWIDRGIMHTAYLVNPDSEGRFLEVFDQTILKVGVPNPKDPEARRIREEKAKDLRERFETARSDLQKQAPKKGGLIITPGM